MSEITAKGKLYIGIGYLFVAAGVGVFILWILGNYDSNFQISSFDFLNDRAFGFLVLPLWFLAGFFFKKAGQHHD